MNSRPSLLALCLLMPGPLHAQADPQDCPRLRASGASADLYCMPLVAAPGDRCARCRRARLGTGSVHRRGVAVGRSAVEPPDLDQRADVEPRKGKGGLVVWAAASIVLSARQARRPPVGRLAGAARRVRPLPGAHQRGVGHGDARDAGQGRAARGIAQQPPQAGRHLPVFSRRAHAAGRERRHESHAPWRRVDGLARGADVSRHRHAAVGDGAPPRGAALAAESRSGGARRASAGSRDARGRRHARPHCRRRAALDRGPRLHHVRLQRAVSRVRCWR